MITARRAARAASLLALLVALSTAPLAASRPVTAAPGGRAVSQTISEGMTARERVGQLALISFPGDRVTDDDAIAGLIDDYGIGGVVLDPAQGNFRNEPGAPMAVAELANALQRRQAAAAAPRPAVPLFVALAGEGAPSTDALRTGVTPLPSEMALGATWDPAHSEAIGAVVGAERAALGVNLVLGPSLDVLDEPRPGSSGDLGPRSFGGSAPWVAEHARAYVAGIHRGGQGQVAVVAGTFPGVGGADRGQTEELPIVESPLDELLGEELAPFLAVADPALPPDARADGFQVAHVRYRSLQQQIDRPLFLDASGLRYLEGQVPSLAAWRSDGGLLVSAGLGLPAVRRYVDPEGQGFNLRRVLREAVLAGNDMLMLTGLPPGESGVEELRAGLDWLAQAYQEDEAIRRAVDAALQRVLARKLRLFPDAGAALVDPAAAPAVLGRGADLVDDAARAALTLVAPSSAAPGAAGGGTVEAISPQPGDRILFVVDARERRDCETCPAALEPDPARFVTSTLRAYGPEGSGTARVTGDDDVAAIRMTELGAWLDAAEPPAEASVGAGLEPLSAARLQEVGTLLAETDWIVFAMRDVRPQEAPGSDALKRYLAQRSAEAVDQRLVAFALDAPYYLDTTEIAKLSAFYAVYSPAPPFVDLAVRALFGDEAASGASPVDVPGVGYDLASQLTADAEQPVTLSLVDRDPASAVPVGDSITLRTSPILDGNGHAVPDGTAVTLRIYDPDQDVYLPDETANTASGIATVSISAAREGELELSAMIGEDLASDTLFLSIVPEGDLPTAVPPDPLAEPLPGVPVGWDVMLLSLTLVLLAGMFVFGLESRAERPPARTLRLFLLCAAWGLAGYLLVVVGGLRVDSLPGGWVVWPEGWSLVYQAPLIAFGCALLPLVPTAMRTLLAALRG